MRAYTSRLELFDILSLNTSVKIGGATKLLVKFSSTEVSNLLESLIFREADYYLFPIPGLLRYSAGEAVLVPLVPMGILVLLMSMESGVEVFLIPP